MEALSKFYPDINATNKLTPRIFGCTSFVHVHSNSRGKLDPRAVKCVFVGYSSTQKGYKCYHPPTKKLFVLADVTFAEEKPYFAQPYLQGEPSIIEDKDSFLLDLPSSSSSYPPTPKPVESAAPSKPATASPVPFVSPIQDKTLDHIRFGKGKMYSRK